METTWNCKTASAICELHEFISGYLYDLHLLIPLVDFRNRIEQVDDVIASFGCYYSVKRWKDVCEYIGKCDRQKLIAASVSPNFPPDFPRLDYHELNLTVIHYFIELGLIEEARLVGDYVSDENQSEIGVVDYTVVQSTRKWIVPFTASLCNYQPTSEAGRNFLFPSLGKRADGQPPVSYWPQRPKRRQFAPTKQSRLSMPQKAQTGTLKFPATTTFGNLTFTLSHPGAEQPSSANNPASELIDTPVDAASFSSSYDSIYDAEEDSLPDLNYPLEVTPLDAVSFPSDEATFHGDFEDRDNLLSDEEDWPSPKDDDMPELTGQQPDPMVLDGIEKKSDKSAALEPTKDETKFVEGK